MTALRRLWGRFYIRFVLGVSRMRWQKIGGRWRSSEPWWWEE